jgi:signal transduction histidine kinase
MEEGTGIDLLDYIGKHNIKTPAIMVTALGTKDVLVKTLSYRPFGFIEKPFTQECIETLVSTALKTKEENDKMENLAILGATMGEIVHEISNPLTVLDMRIDELTDSSSQSAADTDKLKNPIKKIKDIITSTKDSIRRDYNRFNLKSCLQEATEEFEARAQSRVSISVEGNLDCEVIGDKNRIRQVIVNLVNNAIDAALGGEEKWVKIRFEQDLSMGNVNIKISDSGPGIPKEFRERLFHPLFTTKGKAGTGFGLNIAKKIAVEHGGNVFLDTASNHTQFVFSLPLPLKGERLPQK